MLIKAAVKIELEFLYRGSSALKSFSNLLILEFFDKVNCFLSLVRLRVEGIDGGLI